MVTPGATPAWTVAVLLGGGVVWAVHLLASYAVVSIGCATGWSGTRPLLVTVTSVCIVLAMATGILARRGRRRSDAGASSLRPAHFAFSVGAGLAGLFTALIVLAGVVPFIVPLCVAGG